MLKKQILIFLLFNIVFGIVGANLKQKNPEELFLSDESINKLNVYEKYFGKDEMVFVSSENIRSLKNLEEAIGKESDNRFVSLAPLIPNYAIIKLPKLEDEERYHFFEKLESQNKDLHFAGMDYTNAYLAGMSLKIQQVLFPIIFGIMFISLLFFFKNIKITLYLFLSSFIGVTVGMACVKLFYSYATILTSLTPLVSFILTLANQLHIVFGIKVYNSKQEFFKHKLEPILIMMGTTLIGFIGLAWSDLNSIRQFGIVTTVTLFITWAINLLVLKKLDIDFKINEAPFRKHLKRPPFRPLLGILIALIFAGAGIWSLRTMPLLVEAILFFPKNHPVRTGHDTISKNLGGTPQVDLIFTKADTSEMKYTEFKGLQELEEKLKNNNFKILSINDLIKNINKHYSGNKIIPDNKNAYFLLREKIPSILSESLVSENAYRISILSNALKEEDRLKLIKNISQIIQQIPPGLKVELSGLNYLLLESQNYLVKSLIKSLLGSFLLIAAIFAFFSRNIKEILIFSLISLSSILGGLFVMNLLGFSLNVSSIMTLSISIGLVDDSTIHLLYAERHGESEDKILRTCIIPMVLSQVVLFFSFWLLGFEPFIPIREFSLGLAAMLSMGFLFDLFILPMINKNASQ